MPQSGKIRSPEFSMSQQLALIIPLIGLSLAGLFFLGRKKRDSQREDFGAFIEHLELIPPLPPPPPAAPLPLDGLTFAIKDIFDVEGYVTGFGNPDWKNSHTEASSTAPIVLDLVNAGAKCIGKTHMDELAYSIVGENKQYITPTNPTAPKRVPGGSSSGSAVAVAAETVDFALGTDTAGSVRVPAAYCAVFGYRPSHNVISSKGVIPMSQSLDTVGLFSRDLNVLKSVAHVMLHQPYYTFLTPQNLIIGVDCFDFSPQSKRLVDSVIATVEKVSGRNVKRMSIGKHIASNVPSLRLFEEKNEVEKERSVEKSALSALKEAMRILQGFEFKTNHGHWIENTKPVIGADVAERVNSALEVKSERYAIALKVREEMRAAMNELLKGDSVLFIPTTPSPPPLLRSKPDALKENRNKSLLLLSICSMSGCPQVSIPVNTADSASPMGISMISRHGSDRFLLDAVIRFADSFQSLVPSSTSAATSAHLSEPHKKPPSEIAKDKGNAAYKEGNFVKALQFYSEAIKHEKRNATYYSNRAMAHLQLSNFEEAVSDCNAALEIDSKAIKAMLRRATANEFLGYYAQSLHDFQQVKILEPNNRTATEGIMRLKNFVQI